ncbi:MAG: glyoxalase, partial [Cycloclasticus pugetii]|nr:glyoxalase [Cycloclasticus pugetii]
MSDLDISMGPINHVAMAVKDWRATAKSYAKLMGIKTWRVMEISSDMMETSEYYGEPAEFV